MPSISKTTYFLALLLLALNISCKRERQQEVTPWGTVVGEDTTATPTGAFSLDDIIAQGELIMLTETGPDTYYDYHGHGMGDQYLLCENFAKGLGVKVRVEVCKDSLEMLRKLRDGEGDIIANTIHLDKKGKGTDDIIGCGPQWAVAEHNEALADTINKWYSPTLLADIRKQQQSMLSMGGVQRRVYSPMLNRAQGIISQYDNLFIKYAPTARLDWRLLAAQCYQESCFDPKAHSWAGACGLMQIIPSTAAQLGLSMSDIYTPEPNIAAAARYMRQLMGGFPEAATQGDRISFALAAYNGGIHHIHDAQALARHEGKNHTRWAEVAPYVLKLEQPQYYRHAVVKYGYMRGSETYDYVERIHNRWAQYRGFAHASSAATGTVATPHASKRRNKFTQ